MRRAWWLAAACCAALFLLGVGPGGASSSGNVVAYQFGHTVCGVVTNGFACARAGYGGFLPGWTGFELTDQALFEFMVDKNGKENVVKWWLEPGVDPNTPPTFEDFPWPAENIPRARLFDNQPVKVSPTIYVNPIRISGWPAVGVFPWDSSLNRALDGGILGVIYQKRVDVQTFHLGQGTTVTAEIDEPPLWDGKPLLDDLSTIIADAKTELRVLRTSPFSPQAYKRAEVKLARDGRYARRDLNFAVAARFLRLDKRFIAGLDPFARYYALNPRATPGDIARQRMAVSDAIDGLHRISNEVRKDATALSDQDGQ